MKKSILMLAGLSVFLLVLLACHRKSKASAETPLLHTNCYLKHDPGPCRMSIKRYYYDPVEKKCKEFIYGGCKGLVPFETLEACKKGCGCE